MTSSYSWNPNISSFGSNQLNSENWGNGFSISEALVLESEKGKRSEVVSDMKVMAALKSHSEAERRRRERINVHLSTLRGLVPCKLKMDKATLLAEVIREVKQLKNNANHATQNLLVPMDADEVRVEPHYDEVRGTFSVRATICCEYKPELLSDLRRALGALDLNMLKAEVSTLGGRVKNVFVLSNRKAKARNDDPEALRIMVSSVREALSSILDKVSASSSLEYSPSKRRKVSFFDSSTTSFSGV